MKYLLNNKLKKVKFVNVDIKENFILYPTYMHSVCNKAIKKSILMEYNILFDEDLYVCEDLLYAFKAFLNASSVRYLQLVPYIYRHNNKSVTSTIDLDRMCQDDIVVSNRMRQYAYSHHKEGYDKLFEFRFMTGVIRYLANTQCFSPYKYRSLNSNRYVWNYTWKPSYYILTITANNHLDIVAYIYIMQKNTKIFYRVYINLQIRLKY